MQLTTYMDKHKPKPKITFIKEPNFNKHSIKIKNIEDRLNALADSIADIANQIKNIKITDGKTGDTGNNYIDNTTFLNEKNQIQNNFNDKINHLNSIIDDLKNQINSHNNHTPQQPYQQSHQQKPIFESEYNLLKMMASVLQPPAIAIDIFNLDERKIMSFIKQNYEFNLQKAMIADQYNMLKQHFPSKDLSQFKDIKPISPLKEIMYAVVDAVNRQLQYTNKNAVIACQIYQKIDNFLEQHPNCSFESYNQLANVHANELPSAMLQQQLDYFQELFNEIWDTPVLELPDNDDRVKRQYDEYNDLCYLSSINQTDDLEANLKAFDDNYNTKQTLSNTLFSEDTMVEICYDAGIYTNQYAQQSSSIYEQDEADDIKTDVGYNLNYLYPGTTLG